MALYKKTIILSNGKTLGYLTVIQVGSDVGVKVVGDSFTDQMGAILKIGDSVYSFPLSGTQTEISLSSGMKSGDEIGCLVATEQGSVATGGANVSFSEWKKHFAPQPQPEVAETAAPPVPSPTEKDDILEKLSREKDDFYKTIKEKVDELFVIHPAETFLSERIPDSQWVKIRYEKEDYYVIGKLTDNGAVTYLGYGVPGKEAVKPPKIADGIAEFLAIPNLPEYEGYWLFFQDAKTGKINNA